MRAPGDILLVSCYELGHPPLAVASTAAFLERAGFRPSVVDLAVVGPAGLDEFPALEHARLVAISTPMHTALRIALSAVPAVRRRAAQAHVCMFGLYAALHARHLLAGAADSVLGGESEESLVALAVALERGDPPHDVAGLGVADRPPRPVMRKLDFAPPSRDGLPPPERYAQLEFFGERRTAAAVEASRGCLHHCRHCPIPPVYGGRFFVVPREIVLADIAGLVARGVRHVTFADPDFFNGPGHSLAIVREMHRRFPGLTFDATTKVEHLLAHGARLPELAALGCAFVVSAVESLSDEVLGHLDKGHTRADVFEALTLVRASGLVLRPTLLPFTPWSALADYVELLEWIHDEQLVGHIDPVQLSVRLLVPPGSLLAAQPALQGYLRPLDAERLYYPWVHPDPRVDRLQQQVATLVARAAREGSPPEDTFAQLERLARDVAGLGPSPHYADRGPRVARAAVPHLTEPWFC